MEQTKVAILAIVVESPAHTEQLNQILHQYRPYIIGRMGIPYEKRSISLISVAVDAPTSIISAMSGKIGMLDGITAKAVYSKL
ncbi:MAG TPA: iron-only hydrogenase system regulator [Candidatus Butyricicoccus stercorigallinarum]|nr:iron-only hydrogenase system regulator [Candidatus Butyricicoccus stercorigallinarum]